MNDPTRHKEIAHDLEGIIERTYGDLYKLDLNDLKSEIHDLACVVQGIHISLMNRTDTLNEDFDFRVSDLETSVDELRYSEDDDYEEG